MDIFDSKRSGGDLEKSAQADRPSPLADRMRPASLEQFFGQQDIIGEGKPLRKAIDQDKITSLVFWGPPGSGKTTLARLIAKSTSGQFVPFSAVTSSIKEVKGVLSKARNYFDMSGHRTYLFIDEIHRFNKAQQDAFLPYVENGDIVLIGATTENPSFEVNSALLSRLRVFVLSRLSENDIEGILRLALTDSERGLGKLELRYNDDALEAIAVAADGDARRGLSLLESTAAYVENNGEITLEVVSDVAANMSLQYDKGGEEHYNLISALHKTIRGGDPDAALYWLARMLESGEEPLYIVRRLVRFASEDIGLADSYALTFALSVRDTFRQLGPPEGELAIAQLVVYLACAPKSNAIYTAFKKAREDAANYGSLPVPLSIRNAPTKLMKEIGYGKDYKYAHDFDDALTDQEHFPEKLAGRQYYYPTERGREAKIAEYLHKYREFRNRKQNSNGSRERSKSSG